ncbi:cytochrome P450 [Hypomontagnella monticulosa]|nr:cytochrome P450 [Hypomontagnella monticulosa]
MHFPDISLKTAAYAACIVILWSIIIGGIRLFFHPLRSYPGPLFARLTDAYGGYFAVRKCLHLVTYHNFQKYGPVIRQGPNRLVFNTVTALHDIYLNPKVVKGNSYRRSQLRSKYPSLINVIDKEQHRRKRKFIGQSLTERSMRTFEPTMESQVDVFLRLILAACQDGTIVNMTERCQRLGVDVIGLLSFGRHFDTQISEDFRFIPAVIDVMSWRINTYIQFSPLSYFETPLALLGGRQTFKFGNAVGATIKTRMAENKNAHYDLYSMVADSIGKGQQGLYFGELWPEALLFIMAGGATTATTMAALFFYLSRNPTCYTTLAAEIRSTFKSASEICAGPQLNSCTYLRACIDEALRISPPSPTVPWREQDPGDDSGQPLIVDGHVIPRGAQVSVSLYSVMHNEEYFPDSFAFKPERWLDPPEGSPEETEKEKEARAIMRKAFTPFLIGDRACAGRAMAYLEASLTLARTLWFFDFEAAPGKAGEVGGGTAGRTDGRGRPDEFQLYDIFVAEHQGPNLVFRTRGDFWKELEPKQ